MVRLTTDTDIKRVLMSTGKVVIEFVAPWCTTCSSIAPQLEKLEQDNLSVTFCKVDVAEAKPLAESFEILSVPTILCFERGTEELRVASLSAMKQVRQFLQS